MPMQLADGFKMLRKSDLLDADPKKRLHFWWGEKQGLVIDKVKPSPSEINRLIGQMPKAPQCWGRLGLCTGEESKPELHLSIAGQAPTQLVKDMKAKAAEHNLRGIEIVIAKGPPPEDEDGDPVVRGAWEPQPDKPPTDETALLKRLQELVPAFKQAQASPIAGPKLVELMQKAKKHIDAKDFAKASTDIDNLKTLVQLALKHGSTEAKAPQPQQPPPTSGSKGPSPGPATQTPEEEFAAEVRKQKNAARARRLGDVLDTVKTEKYFPPGMAAQYAKEGLKPGKEFAVFLTALKNFEEKYAFHTGKFKERRDEERGAQGQKGGAPVDMAPYKKDIRDMIQVTLDYLDHQARDRTAEQQDEKESKRKKQICMTTLKMLQQIHLKSEFEDLGPSEGWDLKKENKASALYAKVLFEESDQPAQPLGGEGGVSGAWWIEALDFTDPEFDPKKSKKKKFIFKPSDAEAEIPGFPPGGSAPREVVSKVAVDKIRSATGIDFNFPETTLVSIDSGKLPDPDNLEPDKVPKERVGSMQHFNKSGKPFNGLVGSDPAILKKIPKEEVQKAALMDLVTLNMDRHDGNFLVDQTPDADGKAQAKLIPIDHGLTLPSREGLDARRSRLQRNAVCKMPASREKFTPEMLAKIQKIDSDAVVNGMKEGMKALGELHRGAELGDKLPDANFELTRRSIEFMKKAASELAVDELFDAYAVNAEDIFDSKPEEQAKAFAKAIKEAKERSGARRELAEMRENSSKFNKLHATVRSLGWAKELFRLEDFYQWAAMNPVRVMNIFNNEIENPVIRAELDAMLKELGADTPLAARIRVKTLAAGHELATEEMKKQGKAKPAPAANLAPDAIQKALEEWAKEFSDPVPEDPNLKLKRAAEWIEYRKLGGFKEFCRLGGNAEIRNVGGRVEMLKQMKSEGESLVKLAQEGLTTRKDNQRGRQATRLAVVAEGLGHIHFPKVKAPIEDASGKAQKALEDGDIPACETSLVTAEKLANEAFARIDANDPKFVARHQAVLEQIESLPRSGPAYRKLQLNYLDSLKLAEGQDYEGCDTLLKALEVAATKEAAALGK
jgi:hypothetical protein